ncbi:hypothetical protein [Paenisporosarcina sp. TG20]|uniref:hypothetical protein n=1 Tax=Paenisporosarcina sp. TG20 TaxID=1211706 RepID=UPI000312DEC4|nr:hypothetical protein [Paenisporosarcina sp. TG20]
MKFITWGAIGTVIYAVVRGAQNGTFKQLTKNIPNKLNAQNLSQMAKPMQQMTKPMEQMAKPLQQMTQPLKGMTNTTKNPVMDNLPTQ